MFELLTNFIKEWVQILDGIGVPTFVGLMNNVDVLFSDDKWQQVLLCLKIAVVETMQDYAQIAYSLVNSEASDVAKEAPIKYDPGVLVYGTMASK